jgi:hypothetical protein
MRGRRGIIITIMMMTREPGAWLDGFVPGQPLALSPRSRRAPRTQRGRALPRRRPFGDVAGVLAGGRSPGYRNKWPLSPPGDRWRTGARGEAISKSGSIFSSFYRNNISLPPQGEDSSTRLLDLAVTRQGPGLSSAVRSNTPLSPPGEHRRFGARIQVETIGQSGFGFSSFCRNNTSLSPPGEHRRAYTCIAAIVSDSQCVHQSKTPAPPKGRRRASARPLRDLSALRDLRAKSGTSARTGATQ